MTNNYDSVVLFNRKSIIKYVYMYQHPAHQVNVSRKGVLCALDSSKIFLDTMYTLVNKQLNQKCIYHHVINLVG